MMRFGLGCFLFCCIGLVRADVPLNCPYKNEAPGVVTAYLYMDAYPEHLDPILSYEVDKNFVISQIYEPLYTIVYQSKPYRIGPNTAANLPTIEFLDAQHHVVAAKSGAKIAYTVYTIPIKPKIYYQPHPGFCRVLHLQDCVNFKRELYAEDYAYQIKRIAQKNSNSPYRSILDKFLWGFHAYQHAQQQHHGMKWKDLRGDSIAGVSVLDHHTLRLVTKGYSSQWLFWLTMSFLSPMPWEIDQYHQVYAARHSWLQYSIGTGPYMLFNNVSRQMLELRKNPYYRKEYYHFPHGNKRIPRIDKFILMIEKEQIPRWNKFLQGYFDFSTIPSESFQNTIQVDPRGKFKLAPSLVDKHIHLRTENAAYVSGVVFNFLDPIVGGYSQRAIKLRRAISLAFDFDEYRTIFRSGRGELAKDPLPPVIMPNKMKIFSDAQQSWHSLREAKKLLAEAGYPNGRDRVTHRPLRLTFDQVFQGQPEEKALFAWFRKQAAKLGIQLMVRENDMNRYHQRLLNSQHQMTFFIWSADFPTPENFLMLFFGPNRLAKFGGPNWSNFNHKKYNEMYKILETLPEGAERDLLIKEMVKILQKYAVWIWATYGESFHIVHDWVYAEHFQEFSAGLLKYYDLDAVKRLQLWKIWNQPDVLPLFIFILGLVVLLFPFVLEFYRMNQARARRYSRL